MSSSRALDMKRSVSIIYSDSRILREIAISKGKAGGGECVGASSRDVGST